jgi:hypothetical protein
MNFFKRIEKKLYGLASPQVDNGGVDSANKKSTLVESPDPMFTLVNSAYSIGNIELRREKIKGKDFFCYKDKQLVLGHEALNIFINSNQKSNNILDIGCGWQQIHSNIMKDNGLKPLTCDLIKQADFNGFYENVDFGNPFDAIWCCHILEHTLNPHDFLLKLKGDIKEGGLLALTVPPLKHDIVSGHINLFNSGLLLYRLILAGFDCSQALVGQYGYNISIVMRVKKIEQLPPDLTYNAGDIERLAQFFPFDAKQGFDGNDLNLNWNDNAAI